MLKVDGLRTQLWLRFILKKSSKEREREGGGKEGERARRKNKMFVPICT